MFKKVCLLLILVLGISSGCGKSSDPNRKNLKFGCLAYSEPMLQWIKEDLEPLGYKIEIVMFDANQLPATALKDGSIDGIIANHKPWIETFNTQNKSDLKMVQPYHFYSFFAVYSAKYKKITEIPENAKITIMSDPTNLERCLLILRDAGLITLGEKTGPFYTVLDIRDNPKKLKLIEAEITQVARSLRDVDAVISSAYFISSAANADPEVYLFEDRQNKDFPLGLIVRGDEVESSWAKEAVKILRSKKNQQRFKEKYKGKYTLYN
jgi:D-methionine transport system substrate-binding protein